MDEHNFHERLSRIENLLQRLLEASSRTNLTGSPLSPLEALKADFVDTQDLMAALHISLRQMQNLRNQNKLPYHRLAGKIYYRVSEVLAVLSQNPSGVKPRR